MVTTKMWQVKITVSHTLLDLHLFLALEKATSQNLEDLLVFGAIYGTRQQHLFITQREFRACILILSAYHISQQSSNCTRAR